MQSSYRIIKNRHIDLSKESVAVSEVKIDNYIAEEVIESEPGFEESLFRDEDVERFKSHIISRLEAENERARQILIEKTKIELNEEVKRIRQGALEEGFNEGNRKGYEEGLKQGLSDGLDRSLKEYAEIKENAIEILKQAEINVKEYYKASRDEILKLAGQMAETMVHTTIDLSDENILMLIKPILHSYEKNERIIITCHPDNVAYLKDRMGDLETVLPGSRFIVLEDSNLEKNGCILENESQIIDLQISKQIKAILDDIASMEV